MPLLSQIPTAVTRKLRYYVYLYVDPRNESVFYVGKGRGNRALAHLRAPEDKAIAETIREIRTAGAEPQIEILAHGLHDAATALRIEAAAIDLLGLTNLANAVRGHGARIGRMPLVDAVAHYTKRPAKIKEPTILIRINKLYQYGMTDAELYDATRSAWRLGPRRQDAELAMAVFGGVVREVYRITAWLPGGSTFNYRSQGRAKARDDRWEFVGVIAEDKARTRYVNSYVGDRFPLETRTPSRT